MSDGFDARENLRKIRDSLFDPPSDEQKALLPEAQKALLRQAARADAMSDDIVKRLRGIWRDPASIPRIELDAADEIERLRDIVEKVAMGSFLNDTMYEAIKDARKYISAMPMQ